MGNPLAIVNHSNPAWYCKNCKRSSNILYIVGNKNYCENCVSDKNRKNAKYVNQNREVLDIGSHKSHSL
jgi:valyl-tRNA synthetase